jgi:hypothetical protein
MILHAYSLRDRIKSASHLASIELELDYRKQRLRALLLKGPPQSLPFAYFSHEVQGLNPDLLIDENSLTIIYRFVLSDSDVRSEPLDARTFGLYEIQRFLRPDNLPLNGMALRLMEFRRNRAFANSPYVRGEATEPLSNDVRKAWQSVEPVLLQHGADGTLYVDLHEAIAALPGEANRLMRALIDAHYIRQLQ